eukprot:scaffold155_cov106-Isochrysis_galbana.AAC.1
MSHADTHTPLHGPTGGVPSHKALSDTVFLGHQDHSRSLGRVGLADDAILFHGRDFFVNHLLTFDSEPRRGVPMWYYSRIERQFYFHQVRVTWTLRVEGERVDASGQQLSYLI